MNTDIPQNKIYPITVRTQKPPRKRKLKVFNIILVGVFCYFIFTLLYQQFQLSNIQTQTRQSVEQLEQLKSEEDVLKAQIESQKTNKHIENLAKDNLGFIKDGETKYVEAR